MSFSGFPWQQKFLLTRGCKTLYFTLWWDFPSGVDGGRLRFCLTSYSNIGIVSHVSHHKVPSDFQPWLKYQLHYPEAISVPSKVQGSYINGSDGENYKTQWVRREKWRLLKNEGERFDVHLVKIHLQSGSGFIRLCGEIFAQRHGRNGK